ncbi:DNA dC-_dU-editing enzyme APOBEC-3G-like [Sorex araneus]|uniref:DNA dC->dU-editing enzyme APOBEC-3G-like n=1 Tax=Sorex araneus TaxID=42254 RepID=UPI0024335315|nr:DNA dC->dU-editing enzyme APOBEC-3G-like [Sorex araneus]
MRRYPMEQLERNDFLFRFRNFPLAPGWDFGVLCGLVERLQLGTVVSSDTRVFESQVNWHAELSFLNWLWSLKPPNGDFLVTCFVSWSPCSGCAERVGEFLRAHPNVRLRVLAARLLAPWDPANREGLRQLHQQGVLVDVMSLQDFRWSWELFVRPAGAAFEPWWGLVRNHGLLFVRLQDILGWVQRLSLAPRRLPAAAQDSQNDAETGGPAARGQFLGVQSLAVRVRPRGRGPRFLPARRTRMEIDTFMQHFDNSRSNYIGATLLCYDVQGAGNQRRGFLLNRGLNTDCPAHAEVLLLRRMVEDWSLTPELPCSVTCYISWSPCGECAWELVQFLRQHRRVELSIRAARIYSKPARIYSRFEYQEGLRALRDAGARVSIMTRADFEHCWATFVHSEGQPFDPPPYLEDTSADLAKELEDILQTQEGSARPSGP